MVKFIKQIYFVKSKTIQAEQNQHLLKLNNCLLGLLPFVLIFIPSISLKLFNYTITLPII